MRQYFYILEQHVENKIQNILQRCLKTQKNEIILDQIMCHVVKWYKFEL